MTQPLIPPFTMPNFSITIEIDGACRNNGTAAAIAAIGVYFKANSPHNISKVLQDPNPTNQRAELAAGIHALEHLCVMASHPGSVLSHAEIQSDSNYLVQGLNDWTPRWKRNGYKTAHGPTVANANMFIRLDELSGILAHTFAIATTFRHVSRTLNTRADALANKALNTFPRRLQPDTRAWIVAPSTPYHMCKCRSVFTSYRVIQALELFGPDGPLGIFALGIGTVTLKLTLSTGESRTTKLYDVLHVPGILFNIFSPWTCSLDLRSGVLTGRGGEEVAFAPVRDGLMVLQLMGGAGTVYPLRTPVEEKAQFFTEAWISEEPWVLG